MVFSEIKVILRAVDAMPAENNFRMLIDVLKGKNGSLFKTSHLYYCPSFGYYRSLSRKEIASKINNLIDNGYLVKKRKLITASLAYTPKGWQMEQSILENEIFRLFSELSSSKKIQLSFFQDLKYLNPTIAERVLTKIKLYSGQMYIKPLEIWLKYADDPVNDSIEETLEELKAANKSSVTFT